MQCSLCKLFYTDNIYFDNKAQVFKCASCVNLFNPQQCLESHINDWKACSDRLEGFAKFFEKNVKAQATIEKYIFKDKKFTIKNEDVAFEGSKTFIEFSEKQIQEAVDLKINQLPLCKDYKEVLGAINQILE